MCETAIQGHSRSSIVPIDTTYMTLPISIRISNPTSIFNCSWDVPSFHIHTHLSSRCNWKKMAGSRWTCFGVRVTRTYYWNWAHFILTFDPETFYWILALLSKINNTVKFTNILHTYYFKISWYFIILTHNYCTSVSSTLVRCWYY